MSRRRRAAKWDPLPDLVDWVEAGAVVPVKNQGTFCSTRSIHQPKAACMHLNSLLSPGCHRSGVPHPSQMTRTNFVARH
jgi:hypothetical protein